MAATHHGTQMHNEAGAPQTRAGSTCSHDQLTQLSNDTPDAAQDAAHSNIGCMCWPNHRHLHSGDTCTCSCVQDAAQGDTTTEVGTLPGTLPMHPTNRSQPGQDIRAHCNSNACPPNNRSIQLCAVCRCMQTTHRHSSSRFNQLINPTTTAQGEHLYSPSRAQLALTRRHCQCVAHTGRQPNKPSCMSMAVELDHQSAHGPERKRRG